MTFAGMPLSKSRHNAALYGAECAWAIQKNFGLRFERLACERGNAPALVVSDQRTFSFADLASHIRSIGCRIEQWGGRPRRRYSRSHRESSGAGFCMLAGSGSICPAEVEHVVEQMRGVIEAAAFALPHRTLGEELAVAVVREGQAAPA